MDKQPYEDIKVIAETIEFYAENNDKINVLRQVQEMRETLILIENGYKS